MTSAAREIAWVVTACRAVATASSRGYCTSGGLAVAARLEAFSRRVERGVLIVRVGWPWGSPGYDAALTLGVALGRAASQAETAKNSCTGKFSGPESKMEDRDGVARNYVARACVVLLGARQMWPRAFGEAWLRSSSREL